MSSRTYRIFARIQLGVGVALLAIGLVMLVVVGPSMLNLVNLFVAVCIFSTGVIMVRSSNRQGRT